MKKNNKNNNLFTYATGELSQDAFLCWLFSYAMPDADDEPILKACATDFLKQFVPELEKEEKIVITTKPEKQTDSIDVLLTVNDKYKIIIEDKTNTSEHDNQLQRYYNDVKNKFPNCEIAGIYFKTGFQSNKNQINKSGYKYFGIDKILSTIEKYIDKTDNIILCNYYEINKDFF